MEQAAITRTVGVAAGVFAPGHIGELTRIIPFEMVDEVLTRSGAVQRSLFEICTRLATKHGLGMSRQAISQHLAVLESAGLVVSRRQGRHKFHDLDTDPLERILTRWLRPDAPENTS